MHILSANLEYMFKEAGDSLESRILAAAEAGITHVEIFSMDNRDPDSVGRVLHETGITLHSMVVDPRIMLVIKENHNQFLETFEATAQLAIKLGCKHLVCGSGTGAPFLPRAISRDTVAEAIEQAANIALKYDITLLLEAVNTRVDHPGVFFSRTEDTFYLANKLARENVKILYDIYHSIAEDEDVSSTLTMIKDHIGHVQIADFPGRGEPGTGTLNWSEILRLVDDSGYQGPIGVECYPQQTPTSAALTYIQTLLKN